MSHGASSNDPTRVSGRLSTAELARRLGVETTWVDRLAAAGAIEPAADGTYDPGDVHRVRLLLAFEESGVPLDVLIEASAAGRISLRYYDELHQPPTTLTGRTYDAFAASLGDRRALLPQLFVAFGIAEPDGDVELSTDDETVLAGCLDALAATGEPDLVLRAIRMFGEGLRRAADAALGIYAEAVSTDRRRHRRASGGRSVQPGVAALGPLRSELGRPDVLAHATPHEPRDRRLQHRRERADPRGDLASWSRDTHRRRPSRSSISRASRASRRRSATRPRPRSRSGSATSPSRPSGRTTAAW